MKQIFLPILLLTVGCVCSRPQNGNALCGGDKDEHGCVGSAGYTWSEAQQRCIRIFEEGVRLAPAAGQDSTYAAYIVFSPDSTQAELFLPKEGRGPLLDRRSLPGGGYAWNIEDDDTKNIRRPDGVWIVEQRGNLLWKEE